MSDFSVIGIVGYQASGKTAVASQLVGLGAARVRMGEVVWEEVKKRDLEVNEENVAEVAKELREKEGMEAIATRCVPLIREKLKENDAVVVDGIRGAEEVKKFKNEFGNNFVLISVKASEKTRYDRIKSRKREDDIVDFESFKEKDKRESEWGLGEAMDYADFTVENEGSLRDLKLKISKIFEEVTGQDEDQSENRNLSE